MISLRTEVMMRITLSVMQNNIGEKVSCLSILSIVGIYRILYAIIYYIYTEI